MGLLPGTVPYSLLATLVLLLHLAVVLFLLGGFLCIIAGNRLGWRWVNGFRFRCLHVVLMAVVTAETWLGVTCPLTVWENWLKARAGLATYGSGFIEYWLRRLLYYDLPAWAFLLAYSVFALLVIATWHIFPPRSRRRRP